MKFAEYVDWILLCKHCKFGDKICYSSTRDIEFPLGGYFLLARPVYQGVAVAVNTRDVTDSKSASKSDRIHHFLKSEIRRILNISDHDGFTDLEIFVSVHLYNFRK